MDDMYDMNNIEAEVYLVPHGLPQFLNYTIDSQGELHFAAKSEIVPLTETEDKETGQKSFIAKDGTAYTDTDVCVLKVSKELQYWCGKWFPVPFLRVRDGGTLGHGPVHWVCARLIRSADRRTWRVVFAFDTLVENTSGENYSALKNNDFGACFKLAWDYSDNSGFLGIDYIEEWISSIYSPDNREDDPGYIKSYLTILYKLKYCVETVKITASTNEDNRIEVDLMLDIGNSRTIGLLVERGGDNENKTYPLQIRDMSEPEKIYADPFDTCVEFSKVSIAPHEYNNRAHRNTLAFAWPSPARTGPEATRLARKLCKDGPTGLSSPKRYLWDTRPRGKRRWHWHTDQNPEQVNSMLNIDAQGIPLDAVRGDVPDCFFHFGKSRSLSLRPEFSHSSMMMFLLIEIIVQALLTINSPWQRYTCGQQERPRWLKNIVLTFPAGMSFEEQSIFRFWAKAAVDTLWENLLKCRNWKDTRSVRFLDKPQVFSNWDEATCTQLVYLCNEIHKYGDDAATFFKYAKLSTDKKDAIRIATIDMGGGTTDLVVNDIQLRTKQPWAVQPEIKFYESFDIAGDDVLRDIIDRHVFKSIIDVLGIDRDKIRDFFSQQSDIQKANQCAQCVRQVAIPAALRILSAYEEGKDAVLSFDECFVDVPDSGVVEYFGCSHEKFRKVKFAVCRNDIDETMKGKLNMLLPRVCQVIRAYNCDIVLLAGRPGCWPYVVDTVVQYLPLLADRIYPMDKYRVGSWYPLGFRRGDGVIVDPKSTVAVGAMLGSQSFTVENIRFILDDISYAPRAHHIGIVTPPNFTELAEIGSDTANKACELELPLSIGYKQLDNVFWPMTRQFYVDVDNERYRGKIIRTTLEISPPPRTDSEGKYKRILDYDFALKIVGATCNGVDVKLKCEFRTASSDKKSWKDTGIIYDN